MNSSKLRLHVTDLQYGDEKISKLHACIEYIANCNFLQWTVFSTLKLPLYNPPPTCEAKFNTHLKMCV